MRKSAMNYFIKYGIKEYDMVRIKENGLVGLLIDFYRRSCIVEFENLDPELEKDLDSTKWDFNSDSYSFFYCDISELEKVED